MITVKLRGNLGQLFCQEIQLAVGSVSEAISALKANFADFWSYLIDAAKNGVNYRIMVDDQILDSFLLTAPLPEDAVIKIVPIPKGAGTTFRVIAGIALLGLGIAGVGFLAFTPSTLIITGAALLLGALRGKVKSPGDDEKDNKRSQIFGGPQTMTQEGGRVQIAYGIILCGWMLVSQRIRTSYQPA